MKNIYRMLLNLRNIEEVKEYLSLKNINITCDDIFNLRKFFNYCDDHSNVLNVKQLDVVIGGVLHFIVLPKNMSESYADSGASFEQCFSDLKFNKFIPIDNDCLPFASRRGDHVVYVASVKEPKEFDKNTISFEFVEISSNVYVDVNDIPNEFLPIVDKVREVFGIEYIMDIIPNFNNRHQLFSTRAIDEVNLQKILEIKKVN